MSQHGLVIHRNIVTYGNGILDSDIASARRELQRGRQAYADAIRSAMGYVTEGKPVVRFSIDCSSAVFIMNVCGWLPEQTLTNRNHSRSPLMTRLLKRLVLGENCEFAMHTVSVVCVKR